MDLKNHSSENQVLGLKLKEKDQQQSNAGEEATFDEVDNCTARGRTPLGRSMNCHSKYGGIRESKMTGKQA